LGQVALAGQGPRDVLLGDARREQPEQPASDAGPEQQAGRPVLVLWQEGPADRGVRDERRDPVGVADSKPVPGGSAARPREHGSAIDDEVVEERQEQLGLSVDRSAVAELGAEVTGPGEHDRRDAVAGEETRHERGGVDPAGCAVDDDDRSAGAQHGVLEGTVSRFDDRRHVLVLGGGHQAPRLADVHPSTLLVRERVAVAVGVARMTAVSPDPGDRRHFRRVSRRWADRAIACPATGEVRTMKAIASTANVMIAAFSVATEEARTAITPGPVARPCACNWA